MPVTPAQSARFATAVTVASPTGVADLYWVARITLLADSRDIDAFDRVFAQVFAAPANRSDVQEPRGDPTAPTTPGRRSERDALPPRQREAATATPAGAATDGFSPGADAAGDAPVRLVATPTTASSLDRLADIDFGELQPDELAVVGILMRALRLRPPQRHGRRARSSRHGERLDLRATLRRSPRTLGDAVVQVRQRARRRPRRIVLLCDISGSMERYARAYVQFLHANAASSRAEVFTFATRLTRLTRELSGSQPQQALRRAAASAPDWRGGTRIGEALKAFLDGYGRRGMARGAVVVVLSDGWERDDPALLGEQMARLRRLAHRVIWVNPRSAGEGYQPLTAGMAAALPHCDEFLSGHSLTALARVVDAIAG